jgi:hypothetical protein
MGLPGYGYLAKQAIEVVRALALSTAGAIIVSRRPENPIGWISCVVGIVGGFENASEEYSFLNQPSTLAPSEMTSLAAGRIPLGAEIIETGLYVFLALLFPSGSLPSRRWKWFAWSSGILFTVGAVLAFFHGPNASSAGDAVAIVVFLLLLVLGVIFPLGAVASMFGRLHGAGLEERQQIKWVAYAAVVMVGGYAILAARQLLPQDWTVGFVGSYVLGFLLASIGAVGVPAAAGVAILKYRLYDIDVIINRTLVYGALTVSLVLVYGAGVVVLQGLFRAFTGQESNLAIVASTLTIAVLFQPLRRRIQDFIDRRFYRRKYDVAKTLEAFGVRLRDEVDLDRLSEDLLAVTKETLQPAHVSLWLRSPQEKKK